MNGNHAMQQAPCRAMLPAVSAILASAFILVAGFALRTAHVELKAGEAHAQLLSLMPRAGSQTQKRRYE